LELLIRKLLLLILLFPSSIAFAKGSFYTNISTPANVIQTDKNVSYNNGYFYLYGFSGPGKIEIYSIIGNKIKTITAQNLADYKFALQLDSRNMYIIRVITLSEIKTFKIVTP
tara:strand:+ start:4757 stop:5095 length:339 start_codon:yes stop_codon:yes gene_type:complete